MNGVAIFVLLTYPPPFPPLSVVPLSPPSSLFFSLLSSLSLLPFFPSLLLFLLSLSSSSPPPLPLLSFPPPSHLLHKHPPPQWRRWNGVNHGGDHEQQRGGHSNRECHNPTARVQAGEDACTQPDHPHQGAHPGSGEGRMPLYNLTLTSWSCSSVWMDSIASFTMATGGQRVTWCGYWPISRQ